MTKIKFDIEQCKGCGLCVPECPQGIIEMSEAANEAGYFHADVTDPSKCTGCTLCCQMCPDVVIEIEK